MPDYVSLSDEEVEAALQSLPEWEYRDGWIRRLYKTPGWPHTMMLANTIAYLADAAWHHPDLARDVKPARISRNFYRMTVLAKWFCDNTRVNRFVHNSTSTLS